MSKVKSKSASNLECLQPFNIEALEASGWNFNPTPEELQKFNLTPEAMAQIASDSKRLMKELAQHTRQNEDA